MNGKRAREQRTISCTHHTHSIPTHSMSLCHSHTHTHTHLSVHTRHPVCYKNWRCAWANAVSNRISSESVLQNTRENLPNEQYEMSNAKLHWHTWIPRVAVQCTRGEWQRARARGKTVNTEVKTRSEGEISLLQTRANFKNSFINDFFISSSSCALQQPNGKYLSKAAEAMPKSSVSLWKMLPL